MHVNPFSWTKRFSIALPPALITAICRFSDYATVSERCVFAILGIVVALLPSPFEQYRSFLRRVTSRTHIFLRVGVTGLLMVCFTWIAPLVIDLMGVENPRLLEFVCDAGILFAVYTVTLTCDVNLNTPSKKQKKNQKRLVTASHNIN